MLENESEGESHCEQDEKENERLLREIVHNFSQQYLILFFVLLTIRLFSALMGNELGWGSDKSYENGFAVHRICHVCHLSSFPINAEKKRLIP